MQQLEEGILQRRSVPHQAGQGTGVHRCHKNASLDVKGFRKAALIKTGDRTFCVVGEWNDMDSLAAARPQMIGHLDTMRDMLEDLGGDLSVTDPVSGTVVADIGI